MWRQGNISQEDVDVEQNNAFSFIDIEAVVDIEEVGALQRA